ncbi:MAG TPA: NAD(P)-dependent oxidoreductase [Solirubrobacteraceae bacterium]|nr:NAD(P)-dependent oxidoreductase [Solirubrobacteraceae bacterium]
MTGSTTGADRPVSKVRVLLGTERFSSQHGWGELSALMPGEAPAGSTVCIVGLGAVGSQLARRLDALTPSKFA